MVEMMVKNCLEADYIIVGAGSAGCVLANALSEDPTLKVILIEAGPADKRWFIHMPAGVYRAFRDNSINWNYISTEEKNLFGRLISTPRGRVLGGSSSINSMVYMRGHPLDYDGWAKELGLKDWSFANCLPYFKSGETFSGGENKWRGGSGPLKVSPGNLRNPLYDAFLTAGIQAGQGRSDDLNGFKPEGVSRLDVTKFKGLRCSAAAAFLKPAVRRKNLKIITESEATKILFEKNNAIGVSFLRQNQEISAFASTEVIISGGAINSPKLLMLSGLGPRQHLQNLGISVLRNMPGVGSNLQDHSKIRLQFKCKKRFAIHNIENPIQKFSSGLRWVLFRDGIASSSFWEAGGLVRGNEFVKYPNLQYHFGPLGYEIKREKIHVNQAFSLNVDHMRPKSTGYVRLNRNAIHDKPEISYNYLEHHEDMKEMVEAVKIARELVSQEAFDEFRGLELCPGDEVKTNSEIKNMLRHRLETAYHPSCTCPMGDDDVSVVDNQFRVQGINKLRIVDASSMPRIVSGNLNAPVQMMAARAADYILRKPQQLPVEADFHFHNPSM